MKTKTNNLNMSRECYECETRFSFRKSQVRLIEEVVKRRDFPLITMSEYFQKFYNGVRTDGVDYEVLQKRRIIACPICGEENVLTTDETRL